MKISMQQGGFFSQLIPWIALLISGLAYYQSTVSNDISKQALVISHRPYITLRPGDFSGKNLNFEWSDKGLNLQARVRIFNFGKVPASDLSVTFFWRVVGDNRWAAQLNTQGQMPIDDQPKDLGPNSGYLCTAKKPIVGEKKLLEEFVGDIQSGKARLELDVAVSYKSELEPFKLRVTEYTFSVPSIGKTQIVDCSFN